MDVASEDFTLEMRLLTCDVFDTALVRRIGAPEAVHDLVGVQVEALEWVRKGQYSAARRAAEQRCRSRSWPCEVTLKQIHEEVSFILGWPEDRSLRSEAIELDVERESLMAVPATKRMLERARAAGCRIAFVSDSYLPEAFLIERLSTLSVRRGEERVYVSSSPPGASKLLGGLFPEVIRDQGVPAASVLHVGDSLEADVESARRNGLVARRFEDALLTQREQLWAYSVEPPVVGHAFAGASRMSRLQRPPLDEHEAALWDVAATLVGPWLAAFGLHVLSTARRVEATTILFLARDGQIIQQVCALLAEKLGNTVDLRYLEVSRRASNLAGLREASEQEFAWLWTHGDNEMIRELLDRTGLSEPAIERLLASRPDIDPFAISTRIVRNELAAALAREPFASEIVREAARLRQLLGRYLEQHGAFAPGAALVVDATGSGSQVRLLQRLRDERGCGSTSGCVMVRSDSDSQAAASSVPVTGAFSDSSIPGGYRLLPADVAMIESFCACSHGTTVGYHEIGDRVEATLSDDGVQERRNWGLDVVHQSVRMFVSNLQVDSVELGIDPLEVHVLDAAFDAFMGFRDEPTACEAQAWGSFPFEGDGSGLTGTIAPPIATLKVLRSLKSRRLRGGAWYEWRAGSVLRSRWLVRTLIAAHRTARALVQRARSYTQ